MKTTDYRNLLIDAPVGQHFAQIHRTARGLTNSVGLFIEAGLRRGSGVLVIATKEYCSQFLKWLDEGALCPDEAIRSGQLCMVDAGQALDQVMRSGMPDWTEFRQTLGSRIESVQRFGRTSVRVYGEMVSQLWNQGRHRAAIQMEEYWSELTRLYPFSLFCGYMLDSHDEATYAGPLYEIGRAHSSVISDEEDEAFREALEAASKDIFGISLPQLLRISGSDECFGTQFLPLAHQTMLWLRKNMPTSSSAVLQRALAYFAGNERSGKDSEAAAGP